ncbi:MaoC family dehydratase N-terminal domain-containing protein [Geobacter pelophilus]|uniref:MaoC family dehydratase N-terminal domain-containing protein n=1 Tax=Geoanaerobacter pelophilus TaxID=60036 RepID=A0AAW4LBD3_9BACT|nr:MaoC/PaaZ C-terminal domain-containing protein [Geoanaerobacter pelophilus]MBT0665890.1 MaoC family dehydratase N-terminal domain-containing protein [Geoanaerobacter pelophilus]
MSEKCYWDDLREGDPLACRPFTLTIDEIIEFAKKYDPQLFHVDPNAAAATRFGGIIASSLHTLAMCTRSLVEALSDHEVIIGLEMEKVSLPNVVRPDDLLTINAHWADLKRSKSKPMQGVATVKYHVTNQREEVVLATGFRYMLACRPV